MFIIIIILVAFITIMTTIKLLLLVLSIHEDTGALPDAFLQLLL